MLSDNKFKEELALLKLYQLLSILVVISFGVVDKLYGKQPIAFNLLSHSINTDLPSLVAWLIFYASISCLFIAIFRGVWKYFLNNKSTLSNFNTNLSKENNDRLGSKSQNKLHKNLAHHQKDQTIPKKLIDENLDTLERLSKLKEQGVITEAEFDINKKKLFNDEINSNSNIQHNTFNEINNEPSQALKNHKNIYKNLFFTLLIVASVLLYLFSTNHSYIPNNTINSPTNSNDLQSMASIDQSSNSHLVEICTSYVDYDKLNNVIKPKGSTGRRAVCECIVNEIMEINHKTLQEFGKSIIPFYEDIMSPPQDAKISPKNILEKYGNYSVDEFNSTLLEASVTLTSFVMTCANNKVPINKMVKED